LRRGPAVILLLTLLFTSAYGAQRAFSAGWERVNGFAPASLQATKPTTGPAPLAGRLVLIMVDGLRPEDIPLLPSMDWLRRKGASYLLTVPALGHQVPVWATLLTGAPSEIHAVLLATPARPLQADTLPAAAARAKISAGGAGQPALGKLLGPAAGIWHDTTGTAQLLEQARTLLAPNGPRLVLIQTDELLRGSRDARSSDPASPAYKEVLGGLDASLMHLLELVDLKSTAVMFVGTVPTDRGGTHPPGAPVPLIMAGAGVREGARGDGLLMDVAPTAAALVGAPTPLQNQGRPLMAALQADGRPADVIAQRWLASRKASVDAALAALGTPDSAPEPPATGAEADSYLQALQQQMKSARFANWKQALPHQAPYLGGALVFLLLYLVIAWRQPYGGALLMGTLTYAVAFHALFFLTGGRYSAGMAGLDAPVRTLAITVGLKVVGAMAASAAVTGFFLSRRSFKKSSYLTAAAMHGLLSTAAVLAMPIVVALAFSGWDFPVALPSLGLLVWFFLTAFQVMLIGYLSPVWAFVAVSTARFSRSLWPIKEVGDPVRNADNIVRLRSLRRHMKDK
jgi:hypothetical protein